MTPSVGIIKSWQQRGTHLYGALGEFIDNAISAEATYVALRYEDGRLSIHDAGTGENDGDKFLKAGSRHFRDPRGMNLFGIGLKIAAAWLGTVLHIDSRSQEGDLGITIDWEEVKARPDEQDWSWEPRAMEPVFSRNTTGTRITIEGLFRKHFNVWKNVPQWISEQYAYVIRNTGLTIRVDGKVIEAAPKPLLDATEIDPCSFSGVLEGRDFHVEAGILSTSGNHVQCGVTFIYNNRVIKSGVSIAKFPMNGFFACVQLLNTGSHTWTLHTNKAGFEEMPDLLLELVQHEGLKVILEHLRERQQRVNLRLNEIAIAKNLERIFSPNGKKIHGVSATRNPKQGMAGIKLPGIKTGESGRKTKNTKHPNFEKPGKRSTKVPETEFLLIRYDDFSDGDRFGRVDPDAVPIVVYLHTQHPYAQKAHDGDVGLGTTLAAILLADCATYMQDQIEFKFALPLNNNDVIAVTSFFLSQQTIEEVNGKETIIHLPV